MTMCMNKSHLQFQLLIAKVSVSMKNVNVNKQVITGEEPKIKNTH